MSEAGEATLPEVATAVSPQGAQEDLSSLGGGDSPKAPVTSSLGADSVPKGSAAAGAKGKAPKKVIAKRVSGYVKWFNVRYGYGFISRHDTQEDVFVHQTAITRNNPHKYLRSLANGEAVEFDVVQGRQGTEAANVSGPAGAPVRGSRFAANRPRFRRGFRNRRGFYIRHHAPQHRGAWAAEWDGEDGEGSREDFAIARGQRRCLPSRPQDQGLWRFPPFRRAPAAARRPSIFAPASGARAAHLPGAAPAARPEGSPPRRRGPGLSYRLSRPRGRGLVPVPKPSEQPEAENKESGSEAAGLLETSPPHDASCRPSSPSSCPQQPPGAQGQNPEGGEAETRKGPAGKPAGVAKKSSASEEDAAVAGADASSAAQAQ